VSAIRGHPVDGWLEVVHFATALMKVSGEVGRGPPVPHLRKAEAIDASGVDGVDILERS